MHDTQACKAYLNMDLATLAKRSFNATTHILNRTIWSRIPMLHSSDSQLELNEESHDNAPSSINIFLWLMLLSFLMTRAVERRALHFEQKSPATTKDAKEGPNAEFKNVTSRFIRDDLFGWYLVWCTICIRVTTALAIEVLIVRRFPNFFIRWFAQAGTCYFAIYVCVWGFMVANIRHKSYSKTGRSPGVSKMLTVIALLLTSGGVMAMLSLWIAPWHQLPESGDIVPSPKVIGTVIVGWVVAIIIIRVTFSVLIMDAMRMKCRSFDDLDVEQQRPSLIKQVPEVTYSVVKELLIGIYRVVRGETEESKLPPSIIRMTQ
jgi:hypothetical protein